MTLSPTRADDLFAAAPAAPRGPVRVGVVGATGAGVPHLRALAASVPGAVVAAVADPGAASTRLAELADLAGAAVVGDPADLVTLPDLDGVVVATADPLPVLADALEAGVAAYVDPVAVDPDDLRALVSLEEAVGRRVQVGFVRRHDPTHVALRRGARDLGPVALVRASDRGGGGDRATRLLHALDTAGWLLGAADGAPARVRVDHDDRTGGVLVSVAHAGGAVTRLEVDPGHADGPALRWELVGEEGVLGLAPLPAVRLGPAGLGRDGGQAVTRFADATRTGLTAWVRSVRTGRAGGASLWDWSVAARAVAATLASGAGRVVAVDVGARPAAYDAVPHRVDV